MIMEPDRKQGRGPFERRGVWRLSRRAMLAAPLAARAAALATLAQPFGSIWGIREAAADLAAANSSATKSAATDYFADPTLNFQALFAFGVAGYGVSEFGEVATVLNRINARGADYDAFFDEFSAMGIAVRNNADASLAKRHRVSARAAFLRAAEYFSQALFVVLGTHDPSRELATYNVMQDSWHKAATLFSPPLERVAIPYEGASMPGYFLAADNSGRRRPTLILNNGSDAQNIDLYAFGGAAALERGYNALIFEGPGQGSMLFERDIPFRPDWEKVVTPVVDFLLTRSEVDPARIAIVGWSFCGESVARAAAFEHRLAAVCLDPGVVDYIRSWQLPSQITSLVERRDRQALDQLWTAHLKQASPQQRFTIAKRSEIFGQRDFLDLVKYMQLFNCSDLVGRITAPTLVMETELEQFYPGQSKEIYQLLKVPKTLVTFTAAEGAQYHDEPMAPQRRNEVLFDWLDETLGV